MNTTLKLYLLALLTCGIWLNIFGHKGNIEYSLSIDMYDIQIDSIRIEENTYTTVTIQNFDNRCEDNEPCIPVKYMSFKVPTYCNNLSANIVTKNLFHIENIKKPILPGLNIPSKSNDTEGLTYSITGDGYSNPMTQPKVEICNEYFVNGHDHVVTLAIYPVGYNHQEKQLLFFSDINIKLYYELCDKSEMPFSPIIIDGDSDIINVDKLVYNNNSKEKIGNINKDNLIVPLKNYVIIVPENLKNAVNKLSNWKRQKGYIVKVQTVEDILRLNAFSIGSNEKCFDKESSVREWMKDYYLQNGAFFCLFIGDYKTSAPIRKFHSKKNLTNKNSSYYIPTDAYFSDLVSNWPLKKDPSELYSCNISASSFSPTIPVGRLLCSTSEEIERYTNKLILYEIFPGRGDMDYLSNGSLFQSIEAQEYNSKTIFNNLKNIKVDTLRDNNSENMTDLRPYGKDVIKSMYKRGLLSWQGHGTPISVSCATIKDNSNKWPTHRFILAQTKYRDYHDRYSADNMNGLELIGNENYPSVAYSLSCTIAPFDDLREEYGYDNQYNMGSAFTVAGDYGGPALLANTREGSFTVSANMECEFGKYLKDNSCIGIAEMYSKLAVSNNNYFNTKMSLFGHSIIGDPEFNIWTSTPSVFTGTISMKSGTVTITSNSLKDGFYSICAQNGSTQREYNVYNRSLSIPFSSMLNNNKSPQIATLYLWRKNYLPHIQIVTTGNEIINCNQEITLTNATFDSSATLNSGNTYPINNCPSFLNIGSNSNIKIEALNKMASNSGIVVHKDGYLSLKAYDIILEGDRVKSGGQLDVKSKTVTLNPGFTVESGASACFTTY